MKNTGVKDVTRLLLAWRNGNRAALDKLVSLVYDELHRLAHHYMRRENRGHELQTTELVNKAWLRLVDMKQVEWQDRVHFFAVSARIMRQILVDIARERESEKRGGRITLVPLDEALTVSGEGGTDFLALNEALERLAAEDERKARVVELRFIVGLSVDETAEVPGVGADTVIRDWRLSRLWLMRELSGGGAHEAAG
ncbi:MAG TPA: sigma-70 family RNA polymerase sigma factor [Blastocatellia bacterium]|nr:sigma-70 family RNA polymerase sigma factor [Blastocatellia bacterium]